MSDRLSELTFVFDSENLSLPSAIRSKQDLQQANAFLAQLSQQIGGDIFDSNPFDGSFSADLSSGLDNVNLSTTTPYSNAATLALSPEAFIAESENLYPDLNFNYNINDYQFATSDNSLYPTVPSTQSPLYNNGFISPPASDYNASFVHHPKALTPSISPLPSLIPSLLTVQNETNAPVSDSKANAPRKNVPSTDLADSDIDDISQKVAGMKIGDKEKIASCTIGSTPSKTDFDMDEELRKKHAQLILTLYKKVNQLYRRLDTVQATTQHGKPSTIPAVDVKIGENGVLIKG